MSSNIITIDGHRGVVKFDPEIDAFRGEFVGLNGGADFYAESVAGLHHEGAAARGMSLNQFVQVALEDEITA